MKTRRPSAVAPRAVLISSLALAALGATPAPAALGVAEGDAVENAALPALGGGREPLLGRARASVVVFFRPGHDRSLETLRQLAELERELAGKPVRFAAVVSGSAPPAEVQAAVAATGIRMPVLLDAGDALYGRLGVRLHPVVLVADEAHRLAAYQPFEKLHQKEVLRARIRRVLGEIGDAALAQALSPARAAMPGDDARQVARRDLALARKLLERRSFDKALEAARKARERDPSSAAARAVAGRALAGMGRCAEALAELEEALRLDPADAEAAAGREACRR